MHDAIRLDGMTLKNAWKGQGDNVESSQINLMSFFNLFHYTVANIIAGSIKRTTLKSINSIIQRYVGRCVSECVLFNCQVQSKPITHHNQLTEKHSN